MRLFFVGTDDPTINVKRVAMRVMQGGHDVPIGKIVARYARSMINCGIGVRLVDRAYVYDNSVEDASARLLFRAANGRLVKTYGDTSPWAQTIFEMINRA